MKIFKFLSLLFLLLTMVSCSETEQENVYIDPDHEIPDYQNLEWINSDPISIGESIGNGEIVLIDFWTYTCVNCIRTFPFLNEWNQKYKDDGLKIIGVHTPEFETVPWVKWLVSPRNHIQHHKKRNCHYASPTLNIDYILGEN